MADSEEEAWEGQARGAGLGSSSAPFIRLFSLSQPILALPYMCLLHLSPISHPSPSHILADALASKFSGNSL